MAEPQRLVKDSVSSVVLIDNFTENVMPDRYLTIGLPSVADKQWCLVVIKTTRDGNEYLSPYIRIGEANSQTYSVEVAIFLKNKNSKSLASRELTREITCSNKSWGFEKFIEMSELLAENSGFSRNRALLLRVEIRVDVITDKDGIRRFNFHDPFEGCVRFRTKNGRKTFYVRKELIIHHSTKLAKLIAAGREEFTIKSGGDPDGCNFELFLQLLHGVIFKIDDAITATVIMKHAVRFDAQCVIRIWERHYRHLFTPYFYQFMLSRPDFTQYDIKRKLSTVESLRELKELGRQCRVLMKDAEMMKFFVREFFSRAVDAN